MKNKTNEEILREQLELLAERSKNAHDEILPSITAAMVEITNQLSKQENPKQSKPTEVDLGGVKALRLTTYNPKVEVTKDDVKTMADLVSEKIASNIKRSIESHLNDPIYEERHVQANKVDGVSKKLTANLTCNNAKEFQELLNRADTLNNQLQETLQQINDFQHDIRTF